MVITLTSLELRHWWGFLELSLWGLRISRQASAHPGFVEMKNTGFGYMHYTASVWESEESIKTFVSSGAHLEAMKVSAKLSTNIRTYTYRGAEVPEWTEAKSLLAEKGKAISFGGATGRK